MATPLSAGIIVTDVPWIIDPLTGLVIGQKLNGSSQGAVLGAADQPVSIYPGQQGALSSFALQSFSAAATLTAGTISFFDCTAGSIVATFPKLVLPGATGLLLVVRVDGTANNAASVTFAVASGSGQSIAGSAPQLANGQTLWWVFNGNFWKSFL
jgi:hypothetical protein